MTGLGKLTTVGAAAVLAGAGGLLAMRAARDSSPPARGASARAADGPAFPRTAAVALGHQRLPSAARLAQSDVVLVQAEWATRDPALLREIRRRNPRVRLFAYVNVVDRIPNPGPRATWPLHHWLWLSGPDGRPGFPSAWRARDARGNGISQWPRTQMTNLTDIAPKAGGLRFWQRAAQFVERVWASGAWDGIYLDVWGDRVWRANRPWDADGDGRDESPDELYGPGKPWERGLDAMEREVRRKLGDALIVANDIRTFRRRQLDGRTFEDFQDTGRGREFDFDLFDYTAAARNPERRVPGLQITINRPRSRSVSADDLRRARRALAATLLQNGYWAWSGDDYEWLPRIAETGPALGRGYLGRPVAADPSLDDLRGDYRDGVGTVPGGVIRRDFTQGVALVNPTDAEVEVTLGAPYVPIGATSPATSVRVPARDGLILRRAG